MAKILMIGDKPAKNSDPLVPFKGAKCRKRLLEWIAFITENHAEVEVKLVNRVDPNITKIANNFIALGWPIIALGNEASRSLGSITHYKLPHPSGRNRQLNDEDFVLAKLTDCRKWTRSHYFAFHDEKYC